MENNTKTEAQSIIEAAQKIGQPFDIDGVTAVLVPNNSQVKLFDELLERQKENPSAIKSTITTEDADSFLTYYNRFANKASTVFVDTDKGIFIAIIDYHEAQEKPRWGRHKIQYSCPKTIEWKDWKNSSGTKMDQVDFALFIEAHMEDIREPNGATMLEIATSLKANNQVNFEKAVRLDNGQNQFTYREQITGSAGATGQLNIPDEIVIGIRPFKNAEAYEVRAKFRYRIREGQLIVWYDLVRPDKTQDAALADVRNQIADGMEKGMIINGSC